MSAKQAQELATAFEELQMIMNEFNMNGEVGSSALKNFMDKQIAKGKITSYKTKRNAETNTIQCIIEKDGYMFYAVPEGDYWNVVTTETGSAEVGGIEVQVYTKDNVTEDGIFELGDSTKETEVVFYDKVEGELNFEIKEGIVSIYIYDDMRLTNSGMKRSAIDIYPGATLNLYLEEGAEMTVDSGYGEKGETAEGLGAKGGPRRICRNSCAME